MKEVKRRIQYLFYILVQQEGFLRAADLAKQAQVTERTIKNDISELSEYAKSVGAELISKKGAGYCVVSKNEQQFHEVKEQLMMYFLTMGKDPNSENVRVNELIRHLVVEDRYLTVDDIAEELFLTKSSIRDEMKRVNVILSRFNMRWKKKNESGPLLVGSELDRRMLMLCAYENHFHEAIRMYQNERFTYWFEYDEKQRYDIRHVFLKNLRESECHIRDDHTQRLSRYLCLMINRVRAGHTIEFSAEQRTYIRKLKQCQVSRKVMYELMNFPGFEQLPEDEVLGFGLLLAQWADISANCSLETNYPDQLKDAEQFLKEYEKVILREYSIRLSDFKDYRSILLRGLIPLLIQKDFKASGQFVRILYEIDPRVKDCPLASQMAYDALYMFEKRYGVTLSIYNVLTLSTYLHSLFLSVGYSLKPLRALVCTSNGLHSTYALTKLIKARYSYAFEKLDCFELYEMRGQKVEDYDCAIMNIPNFAYKYDWPYLYVDPVPTQKQMNDIYNTLILNAVDLQEPLRHLRLKRINIYRDFEYESTDSFIKLLAFKMGKDSECITTIEKSLKARASLCVYNKVCVLYVKRWLVNQNLLDVYQLKNESDFNNVPVKTIMVMSFDFDGSLQAARFMNDLTYMAFRGDASLKGIVDTASPQALKSIVRESLKALPISLD